MNAPADPAAPSTLSLFALWRIVRRNWPLIGLLALAVTVGTAFYTAGKTKIFKASATLQIDPAPARPLRGDVKSVVDLGADNFWNNREYYETQHKIIASRQAATEVVRQLGLDRDPSFVRNVPRKDVPPQALQKYDVETAAGALRARLAIEPVKGSRLVVVSFEDAEPERAQRVLNVLLEHYVSSNLESMITSMATAGDWLQVQLEKLRDELQETEIALHDYKKKNQILSASLDDQSNILQAEMAQLSAELTRVKVRQAGVAARQAELAKIDATDPVHLPASELLGSSMLSDLRQSYIQAKREHASILGSGKGAQHPQVLAAAAAAATAREALLAEVLNIQGGLKRDLAAVHREAGALSDLLEKARQRAFDLNLLEIPFKRLMRSRDNTDKLYSLVLERTKESELTSLMRFNNVRVIDGAIQPRKPVRPNVPLNTALGLVAGLMFGLIAALGRDLVDRSLKTPEDIERELGLPFLGILPTISAGLSPRGLLRRGRRALAATAPPELNVHMNPAGGIAEAARAIRTSILFMAPDVPYRTLQVTSPAPAEGKTTVACAIAIAMAQAGQRVLLIDCDLRRPRLHKVFGRVNDRGVTTQLLGKLAPEERAEAPTQVEGLSLLTSGPRVPNPSETLQSEAFRALLEDCRERYDRVVIDSPPVIPVTDATILSTRVDGVVLVARARGTSRDVSRQAAKILREVGGRVVGVVLNDVDLTGDDYSGSYYRYYGYKYEGYAPVEGSATKG